MAIDQTVAIPQAEAARRGNLGALGDLLRNIISTFAELSDTELGFVDGVTAGTGAASKALVLDASGNVVMPDDGMFGLSRAALAAAGSTSADAAVIADQVVAVTGADGTKGVALPAAATTEGPIWVINTSATSALKVYPVNGGNDNINGEAEDAAVTVGPGQAGLFIPTSATQWYVSAASLVTSTPAELNILDGVTATAAELNAIADVTARVQELTVTGNVTAGVTMIELNHAATAVVATIANAANHAGVPVTIKNTSASGTAAHQVELTAGTFDGTNNTATLNAPGEQLVVVFDSGGDGIVILNTGSVGLG